MDRRSMLKGLVGSLFAAPVVAKFIPEAAASVPVAPVVQSWKVPDGVRYVHYIVGTGGGGGGCSRCGGGSHVNLGYAGGGGGGGGGGNGGAGGGYVSGAGNYGSGGGGGSTCSCGRYGGGGGGGGAVAYPESVRRSIALEPGTQITITVGNQGGGAHVG